MSFFRLSFCIFSKCGSYRWILKRDLSKGGKIIIFIGLNPSIANSINNDSTLTRIINFSTKWDYNIVYIINLFSLISKSPIQLTKTSDPVGKLNDLFIFTVLKFWGKNINCDLWLAWGDKGNLNHRDKKVIKLIKHLSSLNLTENNPSKRIFSLGLTKKGNPRHPLYMPNGSFLRPFDL